MSNVFSTIVLIGNSEKKQKQKQKLKQKQILSNWREADQLAIEITRSRGWTRDIKEQIQIAVGWSPKTFGHSASPPLTDFQILKHKLTLNELYTNR